MKIVLALVCAVLFALVPVTDLRTEIDKTRGDHLPLDTTLTSIAEIRAKEITVSFSHTRPGGGTVFDMLDAAGYPYQVAGEILAWNNYPDSMTAAAAVQAWLDSPGHRSVLLGDWNRLGLGVYQTSTGAHYYVALFAKVAEKRHEAVPTTPVPWPSHTLPPNPPVYRGPTITLPPTDTE